MQTLRLTPNTAEPNVPSEGIVCHDVRNPAQRSEVLARKGTTISADDIRALLKRGVVELHLALPEPGDVDEDEAATRMAVAIAGPGRHRQTGPSESGEFCQRRARHAAHQ